MIRGLADAGRIFHENRYLEQAVACANFVLEELQQDDWRLARTYREGRTGLNAYLVDYAFLAEGLIALYRATEDHRWLQAASQLTDKQIELFWDEEEGGFFFTSDDHETLIARAKKQTDGVLPSGNSVSALNLVFLAGQFPDKDYQVYAERLIGVLAHALQNPQTARRMPTAARAVASWLAFDEKREEK